MSGPLDLRQATAEAGGKAHALARMLAAELPVPEGFFVSRKSTDPDLLVAAWERLGRVPVAVRSSSQQEDSHTQSCAGQFETVLDVQHPDLLVQAIQRIASTLTGSVVVQAMVEARVAGVIFTQDPTCRETCLRLEAHPGRGDALVSGLVRPSTWRISQDLTRRIQGLDCLQAGEIQELVALAETTRQLFGCHLDIEFVVDPEGKCWLVQARPITASHDLREELRAREIARARSLAAPEGTVWSRYNLAESLPTPKPMSWSLVRRMLSLRGAYGRLYRELGYDPDPSLEEIGVLDLICGRVYTNLSRSARLYFQDFPFVHKLETLRSQPQLAALPPVEVDLKAAPSQFWRRLPSTLFKMFKAQYLQEGQKLAFSRRFTQQIAPSFLTRMRVMSLEDLQSLSAEELKQRLAQLVTLVVDEFAGESLKAAAFAGQALASRRLSEPPRAAPQAEADLNLWLSKAAHQEISWEELLAAVGHRGPAEMELAEPRWSENPEALRGHLTGLRHPTPQKRSARAGPLERWLGLRETARHWFMRGWAEIRRTLLALDQALGLQGAIFWLHWEELSAPIDLETLARRRQQHRLLLSLPCPVVLFSDDLEAIGREPAGATAACGECLWGTGLSWGSAEGPALVVQDVQEIPPEARDFVLVCPTTDPGYTPAMARARALVVETGGVLSHGAIMARELGLPAVSNLGIHLFETGQRLHVHGENGTVHRLPVA